MLVFVNVICAAAGLAQGLFVARELGPASLAVIGVLASSLAIVANFADVRASDLATRLFYENPDPSARAGVLKVCLELNTLVALVILVLGSAIALVAGHLALDHSPTVTMAVAQAVVTSAALVSGTPLALLRLSEQFSVVAGWRLGAQLVTTVSVVIAVALTGTVSGYYVGAAAAAVFLMPTSIAVSVTTWRRVGVDLRARGAVVAARRRYRQELRFLVHGSVMGYAKMLHRGADVLLVAFVTTDTTTGVYRLARQLTDGLYVVFDAISQVYGPRLLALLAEDRDAEFRHAARRLLRFAMITTLLIELVVLVGLPVVRHQVLAGQYGGLVPAVAVMVVPFGVVTGLHLWVWAAVVHLGRLGALAAPSVVGAVAQVVVLLLLPFLGRSATTAAMAYLLYYVITYSLALGWLHRRFPAALPVRSAGGRGS